MPICGSREIDPSDTMLTFSIDYLTGNDLSVLRKSVGSMRDHRSEGHDPGQTLSRPSFYLPGITRSDMGLPASTRNGIDNRSSTGIANDSVSSASDSDNISIDSTESIAKVLLSLDKRTRNVPDNHNNNAVRSSPSTSPNNGDQKPTHSYIALISMAILSSPEAKVLLGDIYQYIMDKYPYYNNTERAWRNSIRHTCNLSLNECFIKNGRADNGKGNYWSIHPACVEDFANGDYRRTQARRRARKTTKDTNMMTIPQRYGCYIGYVPMKSSTIGHYPYHSFTPQMVNLDSQVQSTASAVPQGYHPYYGMAPEMMTWESQLQGPISSYPQRLYPGHMVYPQRFSPMIPY